jgi:hypothetical protein
MEGGRRLRGLAGTSVFGFSWRRGNSGLLPEFHLPHAVARARQPSRGIRAPPPSSIRARLSQFFPACHGHTPSPTGMAAPAPRRRPSAGGSHSRSDGVRARRPADSHCSPSADNQPSRRGRTRIARSFNAEGVAYRSPWEQRARASAGRRAMRSLLAARGRSTQLPERRR